MSRLPNSERFKRRAFMMGAGNKLLILNPLHITANYPYNLVKLQRVGMILWCSVHNYSLLLKCSATNENWVYHEINMMVGLSLSFYIYSDCPSLFAPQRALSAPMVSRDYDRNQLWLRHVNTRCPKIFVMTTTTIMFKIQFPTPKQLTVINNSHYIIWVMLT